MFLGLDLQASWIGHCVHLEPGEGRIFGITSRGLFLRLPNASICFISYQPFRGPLSLTLNPPPTAKLPLQVQTVCQISAAEIAIEAGPRIALRQAQIWQPLPGTEVIALRPARMAALRATASLAVQAQAEEGLAPLLAQWLGHADSSQTAWLKPLHAAWQALSTPGDGSILDTLPALESCLGLGRGLTPSGDDFCAGLLLALNRAPASLRPVLLEPFNALLTQRAQQRTSTLSASLIACAAQGSADERLVSACDGLLQATLDPAHAYQALASYGSSSGIDFLAGLIAAQGWIKR